MTQHTINIPNGYQLAPLYGGGYVVVPLVYRYAYKCLKTQKIIFSQVHDSKEKALAQFHKMNNYFRGNMELLYIEPWTRGTYRPIKEKWSE